MDIKNLFKKDYVVDVQFLDAIVSLRYVSKKEMKRISKACTTTKFKKGQPIDKVNETKTSLMIGELAVVGWTGLTMDGEPYEFTPDHRDELMTRWTDFSVFVVENALDLVALNDHEAEKAEKNSGDTFGQ